jgi:CubicO group peptidase (beta-lactamase class C family)
MPGAAPPTLTRREVIALGAAASTFAFVRTASARTDLDGFIRDQMTVGRLPGLAVAVVSPDGATWSRAYGSANLAHERRATPRTPFMLASVSKTVVSVAVMQAVEDRLLDLDADVGDIVPFPIRNPEFPDDAITPRMLLTHTSTISDNWDVLNRLYVDGDSPIALGRFLGDYFTPRARFFDGERNFLSSHPGRRYRYCNVAVALAAYLVEAASGTPFDAWCEDRIFSPLGMADTSWHLGGLPRRDIAMPYRYVVREDRYRAFGQYGYPDYPDGQLRTSVRSLARFLRMFVRGGELDGERLLEPGTVREMRRSQVPEEVRGQGLIWYVLHRHGERYWGHDGGDSGVATQMFFRPTDGIGVITLANGDWRRAGAGWPLSLIMDRLFEEAGSLLRSRGATA